MNVLFKIKILRFSEENSLISFSLIPREDMPEFDKYSPLNKKRYFSEDEVMTLDALPDIGSKLLEARRMLLKDNEAYQADWAAQLVNRSSEIAQTLKSLEGYEFPATTNEELEAIESQPVLTEEPPVTTEPFTEVVV